MRKSRFKDSQVLSFLKRIEADSKVQVLCRDHGFSSAQFYQWRSKIGCINASLMKRIKEL